MIPICRENTDNEWDEFVLVDASSMKGMPEAVRSDRVCEIIDHRAGFPEKEFPNARIQNELIGAAATIVVERYISEDFKLVFDDAKLLYGAIFHNTLNFLSSNTSSRDKNAVKYLENEIGLQNNIPEEMFKFSTNEILKNPMRALESDAKEFGEENVLAAFQLVVWDSKIMENKKDLEEYVDKLRIRMKAKSEWAILNIIDLKGKLEYIFASNTNGMGIVSKALNIEFGDDGWCKTKNILLRKQMVPLILNIK